MSSDKRTVSTDALETLGMIHTREEHRDAIHLAVMPVVAGMELFPGQRIGIHDGTAYSPPDRNNPYGYAPKGIDIQYQGIVDPFLVETVKVGQSFWFIIKPREITSLRHVWSHPAFPDELTETSIAESIQEIEQITQPFIDTDRESKKEKAFKWIQEYASSISNNITAEELIAYGTDFFRDNHRGRCPDYLVKGGDLEGVHTSDEFWDQLEIYLNEEIEDHNRGNFFSCSC